MPCVEDITQNSTTTSGNFTTACTNSIKRPYTVQSATTTLETSHSRKGKPSGYKLYK